MRTIAVFNDLPNDVLFEVFDYLDAYDLFRAFAHTSQRLARLIHDRRIRFQADMVSLAPDRQLEYQRRILPKIGNYLRYLSISDERHVLQAILSSVTLTSLQSVRLYAVKLSDLVSILRYAKLRSICIDTKEIQNEKHLNDVFRMLFQQQLDLRAIRCDFHTNLHFVEVPCRLSQITKMVLDCPCFSSDLLVLISQLPQLRHLNARLNDHNRERMDKDIDHLPGSTSLRTLLLHIKNVELDRLRLIFAATPAVQRLQLDGTIDFDIDPLLALGNRYRSFRCELKHYLMF